ncbi:NADP-dependent oxidoreductase domain-containing protein [Lipomyces orientalis]|uniref:NADP-dependent oxidoreductase domain-containing protein n=1 Tax=Lipomyces orientalis TaxID=1233043 RepID=A0ACC3TIY6_9ASCO
MVIRPAVRSTVARGRSVIAVRCNKVAPTRLAYLRAVPAAFWYRNFNISAATMELPTTTLGKDGPEVTAIGYGAMGISAFYEPHLTDEQAFPLFDKLLDLGCTFWDTARIYGDNEEIIGRYFAQTGNRSKVFLCTKVGYKAPVVGGGIATPSGEPEFIRSSCEQSLKRLGVETIDLYYQHRIDTTIPIEKTIEGFAELVKEGKIRYIGLSECSAATLRRAYKVHPITAVQIEYSPFSLDPETNGLLDACKELGVAVVAYSPLSRGFLTGAYSSPDDFEPNDVRKRLPRFQAENFAPNLELVKKLKTIADSKGATTGQVSLAWLMALGAIPIPGSTKMARIDENVASVNVKLTEEEMKTIREYVDAANIVGGRYPPVVTNLYADTPALE